VIITALSGVGVVIPAGGVCVVVCVLADEFKVRQVASTATANNPILRRIAVLLQDILTVAGIEGQSLRGIGLL
jgi:hypothetical protein